MVPENHLTVEEWESRIYEGVRAAGPEGINLSDLRNALTKETYPDTLNYRPAYWNLVGRYTILRSTDGTLTTPKDTNDSPLPE